MEGMGRSDNKVDRYMSLTQKENATEEEKQKLYLSMTRQERNRVFYQMTDARMKAQATVEVYRGFDDQNTRNAESALKRDGIFYRTTNSSEGRQNQFRMKEIYVAPKDSERASRIIEEHTNTDTRGTEDYIAP